MLREKPAIILAVAFLFPFLLQMSRPGEAAPNLASAFPRNVQVSDGRFPVYGEPYLAVNPRNSRNLLGAAQDIGACPAPGTFASFDGGRTWSDNGMLPMPEGDRCGGDVSVAFDARGTGFVASHGGRSMMVDTVLIWRTDDGGRSFGRPVIVYHDPRQQVDHAWIAVDAARGPRSGAVYLVWTASTPKDYPFGNRLLFSRSTDGGRHFSPPRTLVTDTHQFPAIPVISVGPAGVIHVVFALGRIGSPFPPTDPLLREVVSSTDGGGSFGQPQPIAAEPVFLHLNGRNEFNIQAAATDPRNGTIYLTMAAPRLSTNHTEILLWRSRDGGHAWIGPVRVTGAARTDADYFQPQIAVTSRGIVYISCFALTDGRVNLLLSRSTTHGTGFSPATRITSVSFNPALSTVHRDNGIWIGDYQGLAAGPAVIHPFWNDTRTGQLAIFTANIPIRQVCRLDRVPCV